MKRLTGPHGMEICFIRSALLVWQKGRLPRLLLMAVVVFGDHITPAHFIRRLAAQRDHEFGQHMILWGGNAGFEASSMFIGDISATEYCRSLCARAGSLRSPCNCQSRGPALRVSSYEERCRACNRQIDGTAKATLQSFQTASGMGALIPHRQKQNWVCIFLAFTS